eukprot:386362-Rhodomonas_salina.5
MSIDVARWQSKPAHLNGIGIEGRKVRFVGKAARASHGVRASEQNIEAVHVHSHLVMRNYRNPRVVYIEPAQTTHRIFISFGTGVTKMMRHRATQLSSATVEIERGPTGNLAVGDEDEVPDPGSKSAARIAQHG